MANLMYSTNGISWITSTTVHLPDAGGSTLFSKNLEANNIRSVAYSNNLGGWVAAGDNGLIYKQASNLNLSNVNIAYKRMGINWTGQDPRYLATGLNINSIAYGNGYWAAGLDTGYIHNSTDSISWTPQTGNLATSVVNYIAYGNGAFLAVANNGRMSFSTNTINWTTMTSVGGFGSSSIYGATYGNGLWVAVGQSGQIRTATTTDNISWTWTTRTTNISRNLNAVAYGNGAFVVGTASGSPQLVLRSDATAVTWTTYTSPIGGVTNAVAYGNGVFVLGGNSGSLGVSTDGITWTLKSTPFSPSTATVQSIVYTGSAWLFCTSTVGNFYYSTDLITWTTTSLGAISTNTMGYGNNIVAVGGAVASPAIFTSKNSAALNASSVYSHNNNILSISSDKNAYTSRDMVSHNSINLVWTTQKNAVTLSADNTTGIAYGNGVWAMITDRPLIKTSTDTLYWTTRNNTFGTSSIRSIEYANGNFVAVGNRSNISVSTDAITWVSKVSTFTTTDVINGVAYGQGVWAVGGTSGKVAYSTDATTWTQGTTAFGTTLVLSIAYGNGVFVGSAQNGRMAKSANGITWTTITPAVSTFPTNIDVNSVAYGAGIWVAVGQSNSIRTSTDLLTWTTRTGTFVGPYTASTNHIVSVSYGNGFWLASNDAGRISASYDGINWITQPQLSPALSLSFIKYANGIFFTSNATNASNDGNLYASRADVLKNSPTTLVNSYYSNVNGINVLVGNNGYIYKSDSSYDANAFYPINTGIGDDFYKITWSTYTATSGGIWEMIGAYSSYTSTDLITWTTNALLSPYPSLPDAANTALTWTTQNSTFGTTSGTVIAYGNNIWLAGGFTGQMRRSTDGITWTAVNSTFGTSTIRTITYGNGLWIAAGDSNQLRTSVDGITWNTQTLNFGIANTVYSSVYAGSNTWFVGADSGQLRKSTNPTNATNGMTWTTVTGIGISVFNPIYYFTIYGNQALFIGSGVGLSAKSDINAVTWTTVVLGGGALVTYSAAAYGNGTWVVGGSSGVLKNSTDLVTWTTVTSLTTNTFNSIAYGNGLWLAGATNNTVRRSTDTINWVTQQVNFINSIDSISSISFGNNLWAAIANNNGQIKTSPQKWTFTALNDIITS